MFVLILCSNVDFIIVLRNTEFLFINTRCLKDLEKKKKKIYEMFRKLRRL